MPPPKLIVNADDFGRSTEINRAVICAHRQGVLTSASLMVAGAAADQAVELARQNPALSVGLHLVVVDGPAVLPANRIPRLVDARGHFPNQPVRLGLRYARGKAARRELREEILAQFERFAATGLPLSHVDGHQHMHMHPAVFDILLPLAERFGAKRVRIVHDDLRLALAYDPRRRIEKILTAMIFAALARRGRARLRTEFVVAQPMRTYGFFQSGHMTEPYALLIIRQLQVSAEIYFHPTEGPRLDDLGPNPDDLRTLLSPKVRAAINARDLLADSPAAPSFHPPLAGPSSAASA
jgi:hopanoid biosynthesis associated protein HpnK